MTTHLPLRPLRPLRQNRIHTGARVTVTYRNTTVTGTVREARKQALDLFYLVDLDTPITHPLRVEPVTSISIPAMNVRAI